MLQTQIQTKPRQTRHISLTLPRLHQAQQRIKRDRRRFSVLDCGRRFGKDILLRDMLVETSLRGLPVAWFEPSFPMMVEVWPELVKLLRPVMRHKDASEYRIELITGGIIKLWSLEAMDTARGKKYARVIINEAGRAPNLEEAWNAVVRPMLADYQGDAYIAGTPKGRNFFWQLFRRGQDEAQTEWASWQMPTSANPFIAPHEIEAARQELPEAIFRQEYLAEFLEDGGSVFRRVRECVGDYVEWPMEPYQGTFVGGIDFGRENDFTDLTVIDAGTGRVVYRERFNQIDWRFQRARIKAAHARWQVTTWVAERNSIGGPNIEALVEDEVPILPFTTTLATKGRIIEGLTMAIENRDIILPPDPVLLGELEAYEMERLPGGAIRYNAPPGLHDDSCISLALAWYGAGLGTGVSVL
jgi:hypothetical protein